MLSVHLGICVKTCTASLFYFTNYTPFMNITAAANYTIVQNFQQIETNFQNLVNKLLTSISPDLSTYVNS